MVRFFKITIGTKRVLFVMFQHFQNCFFIEFRMELLVDLNFILMIPSQKNNFFKVFFEHFCRFKSVLGLHGVAWGLGHYCVDVQPKQGSFMHYQAIAEPHNGRNFQILSKNMKNKKNSKYPSIRIHGFTYLDIDTIQLSNVWIHGQLDISICYVSGYLDTWILRYHGYLDSWIFQLFQHLDNGQPKQLGYPSIRISKQEKYCPGKTHKLTKWPFHLNLEDFNK